MSAAGSGRWWQGGPRLLAAILLALPVGAAPRSLQLLVLGALLVAVGSVGHALASRWVPGLRGTDRALVTAACGLAVALTTGVVLGHVGLLTGGAFRAVMGVLSLVTLGFSLRVERARSKEVEARAPRGDASGAASRRPGLRRLATGVLVSALVASGAGLVQRVHHYRLAAPGRFSFDDTSYHLTTVATFQAHHDLRMPRFSYGDPRTPFYPFGSELLAWELTTPFGGGDFAARWVELPFALLTLLATAVVARRLGTGRYVAALAPVLYLTVSEAFPEGALAAGNDHAVAFAALATAHAALLLRCRPTAGTGAYAGIALGLLVGTKLVGLLYAPPLALLVLFCLAISRVPRPHRLRRRAAALAAGCVAVVAVGGYSYVRNAASTGNPFFPVALQLGPLTLPGWDSPHLAAADESPESAIDPWRFPWVRRDALGPVFRWTMLPAALLAPVFALWRGRSWRRLFRGRPSVDRSTTSALVFDSRTKLLVLAGLFVLPLVIYALFVVLIEDHRGARYLYAGIAFAAVATVWLVAKLPGKVRDLAAAALSAFAAERWAVERPGLLAVGLLGAGLWWAFDRRVLPRVACRRRPVAALALLATALVAQAGARTVALYEEHRLDGERAAAAFATLTGGRPTRIAYLGWNQPYLFCGERLQNALFMVPGGRLLDNMFYRWGSDAIDPYHYEGPSPRKLWLRNLAEVGVEYVVWVADGGKRGPERWWMQRSAFAQRYGDGQTEIWRVPPTPKPREPKQPRTGARAARPAAGGP